MQSITPLGGIILDTTIAGNPLSYPMRQKDNSVVLKDRSAERVRAFWREGLDALVAISGDGLLRIANALKKKGLRVVGVPKTIDNDLADTAVSFATECIERLHPTAAPHRRLMVAEVMGRYAGWIALNAGVSGDAHAILIPEIWYRIDTVAAAVRPLAESRSGVMVAVGRQRCVMCPLYQFA